MFKGTFLVPSLLSCKGMTGHSLHRCFFQLSLKMNHSWVTVKNKSVGDRPRCLHLCTKINDKTWIDRERSWPWIWPSTFSFSSSSNPPDGTPKRFKAQAQVSRCIVTLPTRALQPHTTVRSRPEMGSSRCQTRSLHSDEHQTHKKANSVRIIRTKPASSHSAVRFEFKFYYREKNHRPTPKPTRVLKFKLSTVNFV